jgi:hypothetical protein
MSGTADQDAKEVRIDRLTIDIPGLDPARAAAIAERVGFGLAALGISGERERIAVTLAPFEGADEGLAARIVAALRERLA